MRKTLGLAAALLATGLVACATAYPEDDVKGANKGGKGDPDAKFAMQAASDGMHEVMLGKIALKNASSAEIKQFAQRMVQDHTKANKELMTVAARAGIKLPKEMMKKHKEHVEKLSELSGAEFDRHYAQHMVKDHQVAVKLFQTQANHGQNEDLKEFAAKQLPILQQHLRMAQKLAGGAGDTDR